MSESTHEKASVAALGLAAIAIVISACSSFDLTAPSSGAESVQRQALQTCEHEQTGTLELRNDSKEPRDFVVDGTSTGYLAGGFNTFVGVKVGDHKVDVFGISPTTGARKLYQCVKVTVTTCEMHVFTHVDK
jgi:hypothetical protein